MTWKHSGASSVKKMSKFSLEKKSAIKTYMGLMLIRKKKTRKALGVRK